MAWKFFSLDNARMHVYNARIHTNKKKKNCLATNCRVFVFENRATDTEFKKWENARPKFNLFARISNDFATRNRGKKRIYFRYEIKFYHQFHHMNI